MSQHPLQAVIFDLDGVIVSTDDCHAKAWQKLAEEEGFPVSHAQLERCRGVSRMESLDIVLEQAPRDYSAEEKTALAERKNRYYRDSLADLSADDLLPGVRSLLDELRRAGIKQAIGSSSRNSPFILRQIGLNDFFDAVADGNDITRSKPDPEVFLLAAQRLGVPAASCVVIEDAAAGVEAGVAAGMRVVAVGSASGDPRAQKSFHNLKNVLPEDLLSP